VFSVGGLCQAYISSVQFSSVQFSSHKLEDMTIHQDDVVQGSSIVDVLTLRVS
jgi:hypothetical protein